MLVREAEALKPGDPVLVRELDGHGLTPASVVAVYYVPGAFGQQHTVVEVRLPDGQLTSRAPSHLRRRAA